MLSDTIELVLSLPISKDVRWSNLKRLKLILFYEKYEGVDINRVIHRHLFYVPFTLVRNVPSQSTQYIFNSRFGLNRPIPFSLTKAEPVSPSIYRSEFWIDPQS